MSATTTIRVSERARDRINQLARAASQTTIEYVDQMVNRLMDEELLNAIVASLDDPGLAEDAAELDGTLMDGLDPNEDFSAWR
ncbi:hypothetical protein [Conexibacter sp. DBS9H8]|uniref:hypothetical protein n=1 Tax=Conexibacter sp. DBS9H8 TaxID=2937801 RepID=UPI00200CC861|nr:hypothetical protein [Conexibacter sp. DBS9H8]